MLGAILDSVVSEVNPALALELGTYCGYSTVRIARLLPPGGRLITLEFNPEYAAVARQVIEWAGLEDSVRTSRDDIIQTHKHNTQKIEASGYPQTMESGKAYCLSSAQME